MVPGGATSMTCEPQPPAKAAAPVCAASGSLTLSSIRMSLCANKPRSSREAKLRGVVPPKNLRAGRQSPAESFVHPVRFASPSEREAKVVLLSNHARGLLHGRAEFRSFALPPWRSLSPPCTPSASVSAFFS